MEKEEIDVIVSDKVAVIRPPELILAEAKKAAVALTDVLKKKKKPVIMNGEQYLEFEDWQTVAKFYGITAKVKSTNYIQYGEVCGFEARAVALNREGQEISAADAMCLNDEDNWSKRAKYEWKDGRRIKTGEENVPLFQLRSMAQTRACAKALRNVLAWVVVLAGYKPTPAEEMTGRELDQRKKADTVQPSSQPPAQSLPAPEPEPNPEPQIMANANQVKAINTILTKMEIKDDWKRHDRVGQILGMKEPPVSLNDLTHEQASKTLTELQKQLDEIKRGNGNA